MKRLFIIFLLFLSGKAWGEIYNIGPGNKYTTFSAFHSAVTVRNGDVVDGGGNIFNERVVPNGPATYRNFIVDARVSLDSSWSYDPGNTYSNMNPWVRVGETEIYKKTMRNCTFMFFEDNVLLTPIVTAEESDVINNLSRGGYSCNTDMMYYRASDGASPGAHTLQGSSRSFDSEDGIFYATGIDGLTISNVMVRYHAPNRIHASSVIFAGCKNLNISSLTVSYNRHGVGFAGCDNVVMDRNCTIIHNYLGGILISGNSSNVIISGDISYNGRDKNYDRITNNYARDGDGIGIGGDGGTMTGLAITNATISYNGAPDGHTNEFGSGIYMGTVYGMTASLDITYCNIYKNHTNGIYLNNQFTGGTIAYNIIRYNLNYPDTGWENAFAVDTTNVNFKSVNIWNNIIAINYGNAGLFINNGAGKIVSLRNNIFYNNGRSTGTFQGDLWIQYDDITGFTETNNLFYRFGTGWDSSRVIYKDTTGYDINHIVGTGRGYWQFDSGKGSGDIVSDPLWVPAYANNFNLFAASPARDAGANVGLTSDFLGNLVPSGSAPDIGAYEYTLGVSDKSTTSNGCLVVQSGGPATVSGIVSALASLAIPFLGIGILRRRRKRPEGDLHFSGS